MGPLPRGGLRTRLLRACFRRRGLRTCLLGLLPVGVASGPAPWGACSSGGVGFVPAPWGARFRGVASGPAPSGLCFRVVASGHRPLRAPPPPGTAPSGRCFWGVTFRARLWGLLPGRGLRACPLGCGLPGGCSWGRPSARRGGAASGPGSSAVPTDFRPAPGPWPGSCGVGRADLPPALRVRGLWPDDGRRAPTCGPRLGCADPPGSAPADRFGPRPDAEPPDRQRPSRGRGPAPAEAPSAVRVGCGHRTHRIPRWRVRAP